jgi:predicted PurR-regulated permease PerM
MKKEIRKYVTIAGIIFALYLVIRYWPNVEGFISLGIGAAIPLLIGCAMAYVINILMNWYEKLYCKIFKKTAMMKCKRLICLILAILSLIAIIFFAIYMVLPELINCIASFVALVPGVVEKVVAYVNDEQLLERIPVLQDALDSLNSENIMHTIEQLYNTFKDNLGGAVGSIVSAVSSVFTAIIGVVVGIIFSIYVLFGKEKLGSQSKLLISTYFPKRAERLLYVIKVLDESFHSFIVGQCTEAVVLGVLCIIGMLILRIPYAVMIGVFIGFTALIPIAGAYIGAVVGAVMILTVSPIKALTFIIFILILQQVEGNLIYPKVVGKSIGLPGIWVLAAITIGGGIFGIAGMLIAVPLFSAGYRLMKEDVVKRNWKPKDAVITEDVNSEGIVETREQEEEISTDENGDH